jgi:phosphoribosylformylglycinamidine synthase subunit PurQ / glutaminase
MKAYVLRGWGIECENELKRAAEISDCFDEVCDLVLPKLVHDAEARTGKIKWPFSRGDWVLLPGGFSFSDHFGSGKLLSLKLREMGFFDEIEDKALNVLGICNGFQVLTESGIFGSTTRLLGNSPAGFKNRWVKLNAGGTALRLPVRHGEGRLHWDSNLPHGVRPFIHYADDDFRNGSRDAVAGLFFRSPQGSVVCGMMPHPEIALSMLDDPDVFATDYLENHREGLWKEEGSGLGLLRKIFRKEIQI